MMSYRPSMLQSVADVDSRARIRAGEVFSVTMTGYLQQASSCCNLAAPSVPFGVGGRSP